MQGPTRGIIYIFRLLLHFLRRLSKALDVSRERESGPTTLDVRFSSSGCNTAFAPESNTPEPPTGRVSRALLDHFGIDDVVCQGGLTLAQPVDHGAEGFAYPVRTARN